MTKKKRSQDNCENVVCKAESAVIEPCIQEGHQEGLMKIKVTAFHAQIAARDSALAGMRGDASKKQALIDAMNSEGERLAVKERRWTWTQYSLIHRHLACLYQSSKKTLQTVSTHLLCLKIFIMTIAKSGIICTMQSKNGRKK